MAKILIKFPTRDRPNMFFNVLNTYIKYLSKKHDVEFLVTCDTDDPSMNNPNSIQKLNSYTNLKYFFGNNKNKIEAVNADMEKASDFDFLLLASDDMIPQMHGYDNIIFENFQKFFPDFDGVLWFNDGLVGKALNTLSIMGKKYYNRFNYIYNPIYKSYYCDGEFTIIANALKKQIYIDTVIIKHFHVSHGLAVKDNLFNKNYKYWEEDQNTFFNRRDRLLAIKTIEDFTF